MKNHTWSHGLAVFESLYGFKCKDCGALATGEFDGPDRIDMTIARLPLDCEEAKAVVESEDGYEAWDEETWHDADRGKYVWE